jgi:hypothetical protein
MYLCVSNDLDKVKDYFPKQHSLIDLFVRNGQCPLRGRGIYFICSSD